MTTPIRIRVQKIVSGGQTGVDRGALDAALELGMEHGGWCPRGRRAEDGPIPMLYRLTETDSPQYHVRTRKNALDSDATLIVHRGVVSGGTLLTLSLARELGRPALEIDVSRPVDVMAVRRWLAENDVKSLNVAGPRESAAPGIQGQTRGLVLTLFDETLD